MRYGPAILFALIGLSLLAVTFAVVCDWQQDRIQRQQRTIETVSRELRGQMFEVRRARELFSEVDELRFLAQAMQARDGDLYEIATAAWKWGHVYGVEPTLVMAVAHRESAFEPQAVSSVGAVGVMQVMPGVWGLDPQRLTDIDYNVQQGTRILRHYLERSGGDVGRALFAYWGGDPDRHGMGYPERVLESKYFK